MTQDPNLLAQRYFNQIVKNGRCGSGIILAHDIHDSTVRALTGVANLSTLGANSPSTGLIAKLKAAGCKFVALDKDKRRTEALLGRPIQGRPDVPPPVVSEIPDRGWVRVAMPTLLKARQASGTDLPDNDKCSLSVGDSVGFNRIASSDNHWKISIESQNAKCTSISGVQKEAFVFKEHVKLIPRVCQVDASPNANIRAEKSTSSEILGTVQDGDGVDIISIEGEWFGIPFRGANNGLAFMHNSVFEPACNL
jgi:hypothetical protein